MGEFFPAVVYILCCLTAAACAWLLGKGYRASGVRLLLWSSICFLFLTMNNALLIVDLLILPTLDLRIARLVMALAAVGSLTWGFIWDVEEN